MHLRQCVVCLRLATVFPVPQSVKSSVAETPDFCYVTLTPRTIKYFAGLILTYIKTPDLNKHLSAYRADTLLTLCELLSWSSTECHVQYLPSITCFSCTLPYTLSWPIICVLKVTLSSTLSLVTTSLPSTTNFPVLGNLHSLTLHYLLQCNIHVQYSLAISKIKCSN